LVFGSIAPQTPEPPDPCPLRIQLVATSSKPQFYPVGKSPDVVPSTDPWIARQQLHAAAGAFSIHMPEFH